MNEACPLPRILVSLSKQGAQECRILLRSQDVGKVVRPLGLPGPAAVLGAPSSSHSDTPTGIACWAPLSGSGMLDPILRAIVRRSMPTAASYPDTKVLHAFIHPRFPTVVLDEYLLVLELVGDTARADRFVAFAPGQPAFSRSAQRSAPTGLQPADRGFEFLTPTRCRRHNVSFGQGQFRFPSLR